MQKKKTQQASQTLNLSTSVCSLLTSTLLLSSPFLKAQEPTSHKVLAITEIVAHPSLQEAKKGIFAGLKREGFEVGKNLKILDENAQGNIANANMIAKRFVSVNPDLILAISTPSAQAVRNAAKGTSIPVVFSSVSDPVGAGLVDSLEVEPKNITGSMDAQSLSDMQSLLKQLLPKIKTLGVLYNAGEANSARTIASLKTILDPQIKLVESSVPSSNLVLKGMQTLISKVDAIYIPSDNTVFSALPKVIQTAREHKIPLISSDPDSVRLGALACYGYTQYAVGETAGYMAARVLKGEKLASLKIRTPAKADVLVNKKTADILKIAVPSEFQKITITLVD